MLRWLKGWLPGEGVCELGLGHAAFREVKWGFLEHVTKWGGPDPPCTCCLGADNQRDVRAQIITQVMADAALIRLKMESGLV